ETGESRQRPLYTRSRRQSMPHFHRGDHPAVHCRSVRDGPGRRLLFEGKRAYCRGPSRDRSVPGGSPGSGQGGQTMKAAKLSRLVWLAVLAMAIPTFGHAQDKKDSPPAPRGDSQPKAATATTTTAAVPIYKPPLRGAPGGRVGGGTRGSGREVF